MSDKMHSHNYGWKKDKADSRDIKFMAPKPIALPSTLDLSKQFYPPVQDQGQIGSCTSFGIGTLHMYRQMVQRNRKVFMPSHLFIYWYERYMEGTVNQDSGAMIRDGIKAINKVGVCEETIWPYVASKFRDKPSPAAFQDAMYHQSISYQSVPQNEISIKQALAYGNPIVFGIRIYPSFETPAVAESGTVPMPWVREKVLGGHCINMCGYDDASRRFKCQNSWGTGWGQHGFFTLPYDYVLSPNLASDFWIVTSVEAGH